jgi:hypothetical protein
MRLPRVANGHKLGERLKLRIGRLVLGDEPPDVVKALLYRRTFFGAPFSRLLQETMRGRSEWSIGDRELMAMFVSSKNRCVF